MAQVLRDDLDFNAYERDTECRAKVRNASAFTDDLLKRFLPAERQTLHPEMFSTKMRGELRFRPGEVTCWSGYSKHRKSMFTGQVALDLCVQNQRTLMASFEMYPVDTLARMARQAFAVEKPASPSLEHFSKWTDGRLWLFDHVGRIDPKRCVAMCRFFAEELGGKQVFLDSMMMIVASEERMDEQKQFATDMVRLAQETGLHVHVITHCRKPQAGDESKPPTKYDVRGAAAITDQAHNIVTVWANKAKKAKLEQNPLDLTVLDEPDALISVEGQRNAPFEGKLKMWFHEPSMRFMDDRHSPCEPYVLRAAA